MSSINDELNITSTISPVTCNIGDIITYIIQITVPEGIVAYNLQLNVDYPYELQEIIENTFSLNGDYLSTSPTIKNGEIIFKSIDKIDASDEEVTSVYIFKAKVLNAHLPTNAVLNVYDNSVAQQISNVYVNWSDDSRISFNEKNSDTGTLYVKLPYLSLEYEHRNLTKKQEFTKNEIDFNIGDTIEHRMILINTGQSEATNIVIKNKLLLIFKIQPISFSFDLGNYDFNSDKNEITWNLPVLESEKVTAFTFTAQVLPNMSLIKDVQNYVKGQYTIPPVRTEEFISNTLILNNNGASFGVKSSSNIIVVKDKFQYIITIKVFKGTQITNLKVYDVLPLDQKYVGNLTQTINSGNATILKPELSIDSNNQQVLEIPQVTEWGKPGYVNATENITIVYIFDVIDNTIAFEYPYYEKKINNCYMTWQADSYNGIQTNKTTTTCEVEVTTPKVSILKQQVVEGDSNEGYSQNEVFVSAGNKVNYRVTISCEGSAPAFNVIVTDKLQPCFVFDRNISSTIQGSVNVPGVGQTGSVIWTIPKINPGEILEYEYALTINNTVSLSDQYISISECVYYSSLGNSSEFNCNSNQLLVLIKGLNVIYTCDKSVIYFGQNAKFTINIDIPKGTTVYNLQILCILPQGYNYIEGSWKSSLTSQGKPIITPEGILQYIEPNVQLNGKGKALTLTYSYEINLGSFPFASPYTQLQDNVCNVTWLNTPDSHLMNTTLASCLLRINGSNINCVKSQRNVTKGQTEFTLKPLSDINIGDNIDYQLTINNNGYAPAYNVYVTDPLPLQYMSSEPYEIREQNNTINWNVGKMQVNEKKNLIVHCVVPSDYKKGTQLFNTFHCDYSNADWNYLVNLVNSNTVGIELNMPTIISYFKSVVIDTSSQVGVIYTDVQGTSVIEGQQVTYYIKVNVQPNTVIYNASITSILTKGQKYTPNTFKGNGTLVSASDQKVVIKLGSVLNGGENGLTLTISYDITILEPESPSQYEENFLLQQCTLNWDVNSQGVKGVPVVTENYFIATALILDLQFTQGLTPNDLNENLLNISNVGEEIYYQIKVTNKSNSPMYNVEVYNNFDSTIKVQNITNIKIESVDGVIPKQNFILVRPLGNSTIDGMIPILNGGESLIITIVCKVLGPLVPGQVIQNNISGYYSTTIVNLYSVQFGVVKSNTLEYMVPVDIVKMNLYPSSPTIEIGNILTYNLQILIPQGLQLFNCLVNDLLPVEQQYLNDITPSTISVIEEIGDVQEIKLLEQALVNTMEEKKILNYKYNVMVNQVGELGMFQKKGIVQKNVVVLNWSQSADESRSLKVQASCEINVIEPFITIELQQGISENSDIFLDEKLYIKPLQFLSFRINVENLGTAPAYNLNVNCDLDKYVNYIDSVIIKTGDLNFNVDDNIVTWSIDTLDVGEILSCTFKVQMKDNAPAAYVCENLVNANFTTSSLQDSRKYNVIGNLVQEQYPYIMVTKTAMPTSPTIGNKIVYNINVKVPKGLIFYNLQVCDVLPLGQVYDNDIVSMINGKPINVKVDGQKVCFEPIKNTEVDSSQNNFNFSITAILQKKEEIDVNNIQNNLTYIGWYRDPQLTQPVVPQESNININIIDNLVVVKKYQRNYNLSNLFTQGVIYASTNDVIQYKIEITNNSDNVIDHIEVEDQLNPSLQVVAIQQVSMGQVDSELIKEGMIKWTGIISLEPQHSIQLLYTAKILNFNNSNVIKNQAIENIINNSGVNVSNSIYSNIVKVKNLDLLFSFIPSKNNYVTSDKANSYCALGCKGNITYILTNLSKAFQGFKLKIDPMPMNYNIFINGVFIREVYANTNFNSQIEELSKVKEGQSIYITLSYVINEDILVANPIQFNISAISVNKDNFITINSSIYFGRIFLDLKYDSKQDLNNSNMYIINYYAILTISKDIKVYDLKLEAFYPASAILEEATLNGNNVEVSKIPGGLIYPIIVEEDATGEEVKLTFNYKVLQYKNTPLGVGELEKSWINLSLRTSPNIDSKCVFKAYASNTRNKERLACLYIDNVIGKCSKYYKYENILLPQVNGYKFKNIIFDNPIITDGTLSISNSGCGVNFKAISFSFTVPYNIIYEIQQCDSIKTIVKKGVLPSRSIKSVIYTGNKLINESNIILKVQVKCIDYNVDYTEFDVCLGIITHSLNKQNVLINKQERAEIFKCCTNCYINNNDK